MSLDIIKKESGNVLLEGLDNNPRYEFLQAGQHFRLGRDNDTIEILDKGLVVTSFKYSEVVNTQIEPAAAAPKPSTIKAFLDLLDTSFFFDLGGGDSGIIQDSLVLLSAVSFSFSTNLNNANVPGLDDATVLNVTPLATGGITLTGLLAPTGKKRQSLQIVNVSPSFAFAITRESPASDPQNRFYGGPAGITLQPRQTLQLFYDDTLLTDGRWRFF